MGKFKEQVSVIIGLIVLITILALTSCSPIKRHARLVKKYPFVHQTDTVLLTDTIKINIPIVQTDTVMLLDSFLISLQDTLIIEKEKLRVKITQVHDSIYIDAKCDTVYIDKIIERKIPVKYYEVKDEFCVKTYALTIGMILLILLAMVIIYKFLKLLK